MFPLPIDSEPMGVLVDQWLYALRGRGFSDKQLIYRAKELADGLTSGDPAKWKPTPVILEFREWVGNLLNGAPSKIDLR